MYLIPCVKLKLQLQYLLYSILQWGGILQLGQTIGLEILLYLLDVNCKYEIHCGKYTQ